MSDKDYTSLEDLDIQHFKLNDGCEIIAYINSIEKHIILVERPMLLNQIHNNGMETYFFTKYMPFAEVDTLIKINSSNIVATSPLSDDIKERYIRATIYNKPVDDIGNEMSPLDNTSLPNEDLLSMKSSSKCVH